MEENNNNQGQSSSILDRIIGSQTQSSLNSFQPVALVEILLTMLKDRDREILTKRFGLDGLEVETLEAIGKKNNLTRERVRQIEKDSLNFLKKKNLSDLESAEQLILDTIVEHGNIISEEMLLEILLTPKPSLREIQSLKFLLSLGEQFTFVKEDSNLKSGWSVVGFNKTKPDAVLDKFVEILKTSGRVLQSEELFSRFKETDYFKQHSVELSEKVIKSYIGVSKTLQVNPYGEIGIRDWTEVRPRDVGDKAYLVLKHHGKPEHYSNITKLINENKFDSKEAYHETVHNELIKDSRFVLIGRGIYALSEWGYKKGVVADVIVEIMTGVNRPLSRDEIVEQVMKKRQVKRNTILVGLSNKKFFQKVGKDKYTLAQ